MSFEFGMLVLTSTVPPTDSFFVSDELPFELQDIKSYFTGDKENTLTNLFCFMLIELLFRLIIDISYNFLHTVDLHFIFLVKVYLCTLFKNVYFFLQVSKTDPSPKREMPTMILFNVVFALRV